MEGHPSARICRHPYYYFFQHSLFLELWLRFPRVDFFNIHFFTNIQIIFFNIQIVSFIIQIIFFFIQIVFLIIQIAFFTFFISNFFIYTNCVDYFLSLYHWGIALELARCPELFFHPLHQYFSSILNWRLRLQINRMLIRQSGPSSTPGHEHCPQTINNNRLSMSNWEIHDTILTITTTQSSTPSILFRDFHLVGLSRSISPKLWEISKLYSSRFGHSILWVNLRFNCGSDCAIFAFPSHALLAGIFPPNYIKEDWEMFRMYSTNKTMQTSVICPCNHCCPQTRHAGGRISQPDNPR